MHVYINTQSLITHWFIVIPGCPPMAVPIGVSGSFWKAQRAGIVSATLHQGTAQLCPFRQLVEAVWAL